MIVMETAYLQTIELCYCGGFVPLFVTILMIKYLYATFGSKPLECSYVLPWIKHNCVLSIDIVPVVMEIIQLDNNDGARDATS
jgi:hypothetical protein